MRRRLFLAIPRHPSQVPPAWLKAPVRGHSLFLTLRSRLAQYLAPALQEVFSVDAVFIVTLIVLYLLTLWVVRSLSRLGGLE